jgi:hypothetical protein
MRTIQRQTLECLIEQPRKVFAAPRHPIWMIVFKAGLARPDDPDRGEGSCTENNLFHAADSAGGWTV